MPRSSDRAATEPLAALVAVALVCAGLGVYADALGPSGSSGDAQAARVADSLLSRASHAGVLDPDRLTSVTRNRSVHRVNVTLTGGPWALRVGPAPPPEAPVATRRVSVRHGPGDIRPGRLRVVVW